MPPKAWTLSLAASGLLAACSPPPAQSERAGYGASPAIPAPAPQRIPVMNTAKAISWPADAGPKVPAGFIATRWAEGLDHPRWLYVLPNGDVLVAEANKPPRTTPKTFRDRVQDAMMRRAGAAPASANRITLLRDGDGDGDVDLRTTFLAGLNSPFGMVLIGDQLFVANTDSLVRVTYRPGATAITQRPILVARLPANPPNNHWTRNLLASPDGASLYVTVGSDSNIGEGGMAAETERAGVLQMRTDGTGRRVFASGMRNPNGLAWEPSSGVLWATVNERDMLGQDTPPDYMTTVSEGDFYGWPYSYHGQNLDPRVKPQRPDLVAKAKTPAYALGAHTAPLGLTFYTAAAGFPAAYQGGAFVALHGSWNRSPRSGYKVVFVPFKQGRPAGAAQDFLTGFLTTQGEAQGRPVGLAVDRRGALLVADDVGDIIWRVRAQP